MFQKTHKSVKQGLPFQYKQYLKTQLFSEFLNLKNFPSSTRIVLSITNFEIEGENAFYSKKAYWLFSVSNSDGSTP